MKQSFFEQQTNYDAKAEKVLNEAALKATARPWTPFYIVGVVMFDGKFLVLAVNQWGSA